MWWALCACLSLNVLEDLFKIVGQVIELAGFREEECFRESTSNQYLP